MSRRKRKLAARSTAEIAATYRKQERRARCPVCKALITARMLSWHVNKWHDEGTPAVLDPNIPDSRKK